MAVWSVARAWCAGGAALAAACVPVHAQTPPPQAVSGPYVSLGSGVGFNAALKAEPSVSLGYANAHDWHLDAGPSGQASLGWGLGNGLRVEVQADLSANRVSGVSGYSGAERAGGFEYKYGGFVNLLYDFHIGLPVVPYVGIGAGGLEIEHDGFNRSPPGFMFAGPGHGHQAVGDFAYQGIVGLSYPLDFVPGLSMTAEYRFMGLLDPQPGFAASRYASGDAEPLATGTLRFSGDYDQSVLLGLRFVLFAPEHSLANAAPAPFSPPPVEVAARTYLVFFDWDRADLSTRGRQIVAEAASASAHVQTTRIEVNGYTDLSGSASYNKALSVHRGESVAAELVRDGVARGEIAVMGFGEANPLVATAKGVREPQNRRVEIIVR